MIVRIVSLSSSSVYGNAYLISWGSSAVLIDCGVPLRRLEKCLWELGIDPSRLEGVFITHEHCDHIKALQLKNPFPERHDVKVYAPARMWNTPVACCLSQRLMCTMEAGTAVLAGDFLVEAFSKSHDAVAPLGFRVTAPDGTTAAVVTDLGEVTDDVMRGAFNCNYLVLESNHDTEYQKQACRGGFRHPLSGKWIKRPYALVERVLSKRGHLSNEQAGVALLNLVTEKTKGIMLAHLSIDCNTPQRALETVTGYLRKTPFSGVLVAADPSEVTVLTDISKWEA